MDAEQIDKGIKKTALDLQRMMEQLPGSFLRTKRDAEGTIDTLNRGVLELLGCRTEEEFGKLTGNTFKGMVYSEDYDRIVKEAESQHAQGKEYLKTEFRIQRSDGSVRWVDSRARLAADESGEIWVYQVMVDNTAAKMIQQRYWEQARRDSLTGLLNKAATRRVIDEYLKDRGDSGISETCALMIIDVDDFKSVNDTRGHLFGDTVLVDIASGLKGLFRRTDVLGRIGGDEFLVFLRELNSAEQAEKHGLRVIQALSSLPVSQKYSLTISSSVGISLYPKDGDNFVQLLNRADIALYCGKKAGKNRSICYQPHMAALKEGEFMRTADSGEEQLESESMVRPVNSQVIHYVFKALYEADHLEMAINSILQIVGTQFNVSRVYIFEDDPDGLYTENTFEWCNEGIDPQIQNLKNVCYAENAPEYSHNFDKNGIFFCSDVSGLGEEQRALMEGQNIKSMLQCALYNNGRFVGFVGFDECKEHRLWSREQIEVLSFTAQIMGIFLLKQRAQNLLQGQVSSLEVLLDKMPGWVYVINAATYELMYVNARTGEVAPGEHVGKCCYSEFMGRSRPCDLCPASKALEAGELVGMEFYNPHLDVWSNVSGVPIRWKGDQAVLLFLQDIRKYKRVESYADMMGFGGKAVGWNLSMLARSQKPVTMIQNDSTAIYAPSENAEEKYAGGFADDRTITAAALDIFESSSDYAEAVRTLLEFLGRRYEVSRVSLYMNNARKGGKNTIFQWVDNQTAAPISLSDSFRKEEFFICYGLYDDRGTAVVEDDEEDGYPDSLKLVLKESRTRSVLFAGVYIDGRYSGQLALVSCNEKRSWSEAERTSISEIAGIIASETKTQIELGNVKMEAEYYKNMDLLTGLLSYDRFKELAQEKMEKGGMKFVLVASDIKGFKYINSTVGYTQGDNILRMFADMMMQKGTPGSFSTRAGGDVFLSLECYEDREGFMAGLQACNDEFCQLQNQIYDGVNLMIRSGLYFIEPECREVGLAVDRANLARKSVDYILRSKVIEYKPDPFSRERKENEMINRMEYALQNQEFQVYLQPKVCLKDHTLDSAEALIRWVQKDGSITPPCDFIPLFEKNGFITRIDLYVLGKVCCWMKERERRGERAVRVSVNLSSVDLRHEDIVQMIMDEVDRWGVDPGLLEFELTETAFLNETSRTYQVMKDLQACGFTTSIDDFGSGYSIMNIMAEIPTDIIKLDCGFVQTCGRTRRGQEFLSQIIQMVRKMGFTSLCEGIETEEELDMLSDMGCEIGQGYYFARPMPMDDFDENMRRNEDCWGSRSGNSVV